MKRLRSHQTLARSLYLSALSLTALGVCQVSQSFSLESLLHLASLEHFGDMHCHYPLKLARLKEDHLHLSFRTIAHQAMKVSCHLMQGSVVQCHFCCPWTRAHVRVCASKSPTCHRQVTLGFRNQCHLGRRHSVSTQMSDLKLSKGRFVQGDSTKTSL